MADEAVARATAAKKQKGKQPVPRPVPLTGVDGEPVRYPVRAFIHTWGELTEWWTHYDPDQLAAELTDEQIAGFLDTAEGTSRFAEELRAARDRRGSQRRPRGAGASARPLTGPCAIAVLGFLRLVRVGAPAGYEDPIRLV